VSLAGGSHIGCLIEKRPAVSHKQLSLTIHGTSVMNDRVLAAVFQKKLAALISGLREADRHANGRKVHDYVIADLGIGSARVALDEVVVKHRPTARSSVEAYADCVLSLAKSDFRRALEYGDTVDKIASLTEGAEESFSHGDLRVGEDKVIRIDRFLERQAESAKALREVEAVRLKYFSGVAHGSFDGEVKEVDLRGAVPHVKLILTAGRVELDCITEGVSIEDIRGALDRRVWVEGEAIYSGQSGLPERLVIRRITRIKERAEIDRWRGSFEPYDITGWEGDN
jgi:hypothetical protein